jgi:glycosyltransferase involved in cell wall biosynthesis
MSSPLRWIRTGDGPIPRTARRGRRLAARTAVWVSRRRISSYMESVTLAHSPPVSQRRSTRAPTPRIVTLSTYALGPRQTGGQLRGWHLNGALAASGRYQIEALSLTTDPRHVATIEYNNRFRETRIGYSEEFYRQETSLRLLAGPTAITDIAAARMWPAISEFRQHADRLLTGAHGVLLIQPYLIDVARTFTDAPIALDEHNDELMLKREMIASNTAGRWLVEQVRDIETRAILESSLLTATTEEDLEALTHRHPSASRIAVVPNGVDTSTIEFVTGSDRLRRGRAISQETGIPTTAPTALFIGSGHRPNIEAGRAIIHFAHHLPEVQFLLAGRHSERLHRRGLPDNVSLLGVVDDDLLELLLTGSTVALNPMEGGSGSNLKVLSYLAAGLPVVSTSVGTRGIDAEDAGIVTAGIEDFPSAIASLVATTTRERSVNGRHYVEAHCDWRALGTQFSTLIEQMLETAHD